MDHVLTPEQWAYLLHSPFFRGSSDPMVHEVLSRDGCSVEDYAAGTQIYRPNEFRRCLGILLSGTVEVTKDTLSISVLEPGELFGAAALYTSAPDYATTLTAQSPCRVLLITQAQLDTLLGEIPLLRKNYLGYLTGRIRFLSGRLQSLGCSTTTGRLVRYLLANQVDGALSCAAPDLTRRLGISRASVYRAFQELEESGLIERSGRTILIPNLEALEFAL